LKLFEIARGFSKAPGEETKTKEVHLLTGVISGKNKAIPHWSDKGRDFDFYDLKGQVEYFLNQQKFGKYELAPLPDSSFLHPGQSAKIIAKKGNQEIGFIGKLHPKISSRLKLNISPLYVFEIDLSWILKNKNDQIKFKEVSKFPSIKRDLALEMPVSLPAAEILDFIDKNKPIEIKDYLLFDHYLGHPLPEDTKSLAFSFTYQSFEKTLTDEEINALHLSLTQKLTEQFTVKVR